MHVMFPVMLMSWYAAVGELADGETRKEAVMTYWDLLRSSHLTCAILQTAAWVRLLINLSCLLKHLGMNCI